VKGISVKFKRPKWPNIHWMLIRKSIVVLIVLTSLTASALVSIKPAKASADSWLTLAPMPTARHFLGVAVVNGKVYAIGGTNDSVTLSVNEEYDPATNTWTEKAPMPTPRMLFAIAAYQNKIYVFGGSTNDRYTTGPTEVYDPSTDNWTTKANLPIPVAQIQANVVNNKIYIFGGSKGPLKNNQVYDPSSDTWESKAPMPTGAAQYASAVVGNKIYVIGGFDNHNLLQIYDADTDTWSTGASISSYVYAQAAGATSGTLAPKLIYVIGGQLNQVYNPENDTWMEGTPMPTNRIDLAIAVVNDQLYAIGGANYTATDTGKFVHIFANNEQYTPIGYIPEFPSWTIVPLVVATTLITIYFKKKISSSSRHYSLTKKY
jgi:N-acetylneuraminic acid mutarotase